MRRILVALIAAGVLVAGAFVVATVSEPSAAVAASSDDEVDDVVEEDESSSEVSPESDELEPGPFGHHGGRFLEGFLDELVEDEVITADQAEEIRDRLEAKAAELREEFEAKREELREQFEAKGEELRERGRDFAGFGFRRGFRFGFGLGEALDDGVITEDELAELPEDHPLNDPEGPFAEYRDGGITREELEQAAAEIRENARERFREWRESFEDDETNGVESAFSA